MEIQISNVLKHLLGFSPLPFEFRIFFSLCSRKTFARSGREFLGHKTESQQLLSLRSVWGPRAEREARGIFEGA
jgi:hypothetical protein